MSFYAQLLSQVTHITLLSLMYISLPLYQTHLLCTPSTLSLSLWCTLGIPSSTLSIILSLMYSFSV